MRFRSYLMTASAAIAFASAPAQANEFFMSGNGSAITIERGSTFLDQRTKDVVRQQRDFSCGSAALATLLKYHYGRGQVTELQVLEAMFEHGDKAKILKQGFSMLDMKQYLAVHGMRADGFKAPLEKLTRVGIPAIVLLNLNGYLHFVVVRGVKADKVLVADPAYGNRIMPRAQFMASWNNILFVIMSDSKQGKSRFNMASDWKFRPSAVFDPSLRVNDLALSTLNANILPGYF